MTLQALMEQLNDKIRTGEFHPSMTLKAYYRTIDEHPFQYEDGAIHLRVREIPDNYELDEDITDGWQS